MAIEVLKDKCTGCGACVDICPVEAVTLVDGVAFVNRNDCSECGACEAECPTGAIQMH